MDRVEIRGQLSTAEAAAAWVALFPSPGVYDVTAAEHLHKAASAGSEESFDEWFLRRLFEVTRERLRTAQDAMWQVMDDFLRANRVVAPSAVDQWELHQRLFDLSQASTARIVGLRVPAPVTERLLAMGWRPAEVLDFPAIAYRIGRIYEQLEQHAPTTWPKLLELAGSKPLGLIEQAAIDHARARAGIYLKPIFDETGAVWSAQRELAPLRRLTAAAIEQRAGRRAVAHELGKVERAQGVFRNAERVARTEMAEASNRGNWNATSGGWDAEQLLYRPTSSTPCKVCLRLFKLPDGMPRLYTRAEVEAGDALGVNSGPSKDWHVRIGPIHPNCVCPSWQRWHEAMRPLLARRAPAFAKMIADLKVFPTQEAA
ncbi:MAG: hypothetical protein SF182_01620 [Deltaproteobacteria bacterium]|nr:hypothetical protein [Deltaproteobacteria bacterium]